MRKYLVAAAMALTAFAGQAVASSAVAASQPSVAQLGLRLGDRNTGAEGSDQLFGLALVPSALVVLAAIATIAAVSKDNNSSTSP
jgi:hypothetical protein